MIIEFRELMSKKERKREINVTYDLKPLYFDGEKITAEAVEVVGEVKSTEEILMLMLQLRQSLSFVVQDA